MICTEYVPSLISIMRGFSCPALKSAKLTQAEIVMGVLTRLIVIAPFI
jgi:hypothetical protein